MTDFTAIHDLKNHERIELASQYARKAQLAMANGNHDRAFEAISQHAIEVYGSRIKTAETNLAECAIDERTLNTLDRCGVVTIGDLATAGFESLMAEPEIGGRRLVEAMQQVIRVIAPRR